LYCVFCYLWLLITPFAIVLSVLWFMASDYSFCHCTEAINHRTDNTMAKGVIRSVNHRTHNTMTKGVIRSHKSQDRQFNDKRSNASDYSFCHCIVCPVIFGFWLLLLSLYCVFCDLWLLITPLAIVLSVLWFMASDYSFCRQKSQDRQYNDKRNNQKPKITGHTIQWQKE
jgi:hypothetical protein